MPKARQKRKLTFKLNDSLRFFYGKQIQQTALLNQMQTTYTDLSTVIFSFWLDE